METERESITQTRVRLYREALAQQREENAAKEAEAQSAKELEAESQEKPDGPESDHADSTADGEATRRKILGLLDRDND
jgi:hypothetical protein